VAVAAYATWPSWLSGRDVIHFLDNAGSLACLVKGYSRDLDVGALAHTLASYKVALDVRPWLSYAWPPEPTSLIFPRARTNASNCSRTSQARQRSLFFTPIRPARIRGQSIRPLLVLIVARGDALHRIRT